MLLGVQTESWEAKLHTDLWLCMDDYEIIIALYALIKNKIKFSSYIRKFREEQCKVIYKEGLPNI